MNRMMRIGHTKFISFHSKTNCQLSILKCVSIQQKTEMRILVLDKKPLTNALEDAYGPKRKRIPEVPLTSWQKEKWRKWLYYSSVHISNKNSWIKCLDWITTFIRSRCNINQGEIDELLILTVPKSLRILKKRIINHKKRRRNVTMIFAFIMSGCIEIINQPLLPFLFFISCESNFSLFTRIPLILPLTHLIRNVFMSTSCNNHSMFFYSHQVKWRGFN